MMQTTLRRPRKFLSKRLSVQLFCLLTVVVLAFLGKTYLMSPLPRGAYPVLSTSQWADRSPDWPHYTWLGNGDLAFLSMNQHGTFGVCYQKMNSDGPLGEVRNGPELPRDIQVGPYWSGEFFPSPDEQWVAYIRLSNANRDNETVLVSADGKSTHSVPGVFEVWLPDSRSFLIDSPGLPFSVRVHHLDSPHTETIPGTSATDMPMPISGIVNGPKFLIGSFAVPSDFMGGTVGTSPTWTPDSKHLSFIYKDQLYLVPVD